MLHHDLPLTLTLIITLLLPPTLTLTLTLTNALRHQWLEWVEMDELLAEVKPGKIKGTSSDGAGVGYGVWRKWHKINTKVSERQC